VRRGDRTAPWLGLGLGALLACGKTELLVGSLAVAPVIASFDAAPGAVHAGEPTGLTWTWAYAATPDPASECEIDNGVGPVANGATSSVALTADTTFTLTCANEAGADAAQAAVAAIPPTAPWLGVASAAPRSVPRNVATTVVWTWDYVNTPSPEPTCALDRNLGLITSGGSKLVTLDAAYDFALVCGNVAGADTALIRVSVTP
jgi:hypothetical protein